MNKYFLSIILYDYTHNNNDLFNSLSSINNQVGIDYNDNFEVIIITDRKIINDDLNISLLQNINIRFIYKKESYGVVLNNVLNEINSEWVTFMESSDLIFSDGSLLDFFRFSDVDGKNHSILSFSCLSPIKNDNYIVDFSKLNSIDIIFGKYFKKSFLVNNGIKFNEMLNNYLLEDFSSKAMQVSNDKLFYNDIISYYRSNNRFHEDFFEFIDYRKFFVDFMKNHNDDVNDIVWSIIHAFFIMYDEKILNDSSINKFLELVKKIYEYKNYESLLKAEFYNQRNNRNIEYSTFKDILESGK